MLLENKYYQVTDMQTDTQADGSTAIYHISLLPDCDVYRGHFPGKPVCPGVCNMETIKECAMHVTGKKLFISSIKQCRLTAVATPESCPSLEVRLKVVPTENGYTIMATISSTQTGVHKVYMEYKGEMITV